MGSFKANKRNQGPDRRRGAMGQRLRELLRFEHLEPRTLLDASSPVGPLPWGATSSNVSDVKNGPMANAGTDLIGVYQTFQNVGGDGSKVATAYPEIRFSGNSVGVDVKGFGDFGNFVTSLRNVGMQVTATDSARSIVEGMLPISALLSVSTNTQTAGLHAIYKPMTYTQGQANNQAEATMKADLARQQFSVNGAGVTVGVLSDSVSMLNGGLADSISTGDLPTGVRVIQDGAAGDTDEGRAMLENIYDIAPGASLAFATAGPGEVGFADNIRALARQAGAKIIVDDVGYLTEPMFQDGIVSQGVIDVTQSNGVSYFSAAGNSAAKGYLSQFRGVNATPGSLPAGRYMNFNGSGGTSTLLPITTAAQISGGIAFQFDQPWYTTSGVTSDVDIFVLDSTGAVVASGNSNNVAQQAPFEFVDLSGLQPNTTYSVAIRVVSGADPGYIQFLEWGNSLSSVSQQFGSAGSTYYPTNFGHPTSSSAIGVAAMPWWATNPAASPSSPVRTEPFSSAGPALIRFNSLGQPLPSPQLRQSPVITAPDGGNTSFFGQVVNTSSPGTGQPSTPTNLSQNLPSFFGTSSAAPNAAAVAALMLQRSPGSTPTDIRNALIASASSLNGQAPGSWNVLSGFGLIDSVKAVSLIGGLQVLTTSPANGQTVTEAPRAITVTFNSAVDINTVSAANLVFTNLPPGVTAVATGTPVGVDDARFPTRVTFPVTINSPTGILANGNYAVVVQGGIVSQSGKPLVQSGPTSFTVNDTIAPRVVNTTMNGRVITVQFSEAVRPSTINALNFVLVRAGSDGSFGKPSNVNLSGDPRVKFTYNAATNTATLDYNALDQSQFPTDHYILIVTAGDGGSTGVTDIAGNFLDGEFNGVFPSGNGNPPGSTGDQRFVQDFGIRTLSAPLVTSFQLTNASDSGLKGDSSTNVAQPVFIGQVGASFPGTLAGLRVLVQFNGLHGGSFDLATGGGGRGFVGSFDVEATTDANGTFTIQAPFLPEGYNAVRVIVLGQADSPPLPGLSSSYSSAFRIDRTGPTVIAATLTPGGNAIPLAGSNLANLSTISLNVTDTPQPLSGPLGTPQQILYSALDPVTASNISNYTLINLDTGVDASRYIASATYVTTNNLFQTSPPPIRTSTADPVFGRIDLAFTAGLPAGRYALVAHTAGSSGGKDYSGLKDAAGNALNNTSATGAIDFQIELTVQNQASFLTNVQAIDDSSNVVGGPRSYFELPAANQIPRAAAPPTGFIFDFANPLRDINPAADNSGLIRLIASADPNGGLSDGDFGTFGVGGLGSSGTGFRVVSGTTVSFFDKTTGAPYQPGVNNADRAVLKIAAGTTLPADHYRLYIPNSGANTLHDIYGNVFDGEFLGTPTASGGYEDLLPNGQYRAGLTGDGVGGGAFVTGFVVVPNGNIIYARPDATENPLEPGTMPDGSFLRPYAALAPEVDPLNVPSNPSHDPNGGANATANFFAFDANYDRNGDGRFTRSALYAAEQLSYRGPVVVVALPATPTLDPISGQTIQQTFVLQAPAGASSTINDGSASVPFNTTLVFNAGSALKLQNSSLYVQNQGSALQLLGGANPNDRVNITSWADSTVGGKTNGAFGKSTPAPGDWGGIIFRSIDTASNGRNLQFPIDRTLKGLNGGKAISGADDALSFINYANIRYAGGAVPQAQGQPTSSLTLYNSRPTVANANIAFTGVAGTIGSGSSNLVASISADFDSFREDDIARGPLVRRVTTTQNSLNGILIRADSSGMAQQTDAILYPNNPASLGGTRNFAFDDPLPHILVSQLLVGQQLLQDTGGQTAFVGSRLYIQPGMLIKSQRGAGIAVVNYEASMNIGSRTYINQFDANPNLSPVNPDGTPNANFKANPSDDAKVLFTSLYDNTASTSYFDPSTQQTTIIVPAIDSGNSGGANQPSPGNVPALARWGSVSYQSGAVGVVNRAEFRYGGGLTNGPSLSVPHQSVLAFITRDTPMRIRGGSTANGTPVTELGTHVMVTNNDFFDNLDAAMQIEPNGLLAGDPLRPLLSGHPYFRGNVLQRNDIDGLAVVTTSTFQVITDPNQPVRRRELTAGAGFTNVQVNTVWDSTDLTYVLRGSVVLAGDYDRGFGNAPLPNPTQFVEERKPYITLTVQSALPDTLLADGSRIGRPGETALVKLMSDYQPWSPGVASVFGSVGVAAGNSSGTNVGAGFVVGVDNGIDPPTDFSGGVVDSGAGSQIRFVGIPGNEATGQQRVPVVLTSLRDGTVGKTVRGVNMFDILNRYVDNPNLDRRAPAPGDGGNIYFGGNSLTDYNLLDPRDGNLIDNVDIRYMTRIEIQGGGIIDVDGLAGNFRSQKLGLTPLTQFNSSQAMTISNSNLAYFSEAAVFAHANSANAIIRDVSSLAGPNPGTFFPAVRDTVNTQRSQGVTLFMYGNTISNSAVGIEAHSDNVSPSRSNNPTSLVLLNNTFYNNPVGLHTNGYGPRGDGTDNHVTWLAMNNIFANSSTVAIRSEGLSDGSQAQYNLFWQNGGGDLNITGSGFDGNTGAVLGDPDFVDAANLNFQLGPNSAAIDASRSEIGPIVGGDAIFPTVTQITTQGPNGLVPTSVSVRTDPGLLTFPATPGRSNGFGGNGFIQDPRKLVLLPGRGFQNRKFFDQWVPTLTTDPTGVSGPASNAATYNYAPVAGVLDALGFQRLDDPNTPNSGFGSDTALDIGAFERRVFDPPKVTGVTATTSGPNGVTTSNFYVVGGSAGATRTPNTINVQLNHSLDPSTVTNRSVLLQASGGDGIFGNGNSSGDTFIDLSGKLEFNPSTAILTIHLADAGVVLADDAYRVFLLGNGANVLRDPQGAALDGENTTNDDPNNPQLPLPSGDGFSSGNFVLNFTLNTESAQIVPGSLNLSPLSDTSVRDLVTYSNLPSFIGAISVSKPAINPILGKTVVLDISTKGDGVFDRLNAATALTDGLGSFVLTVGVDGANTGLVTNQSGLPDSTYDVGPDGIIRSIANLQINPNLSVDDRMASIVRVRVVNSGSESAPAYTGYFLDTNGPKISALSPAPNSLIVPDSSGRVTFGFTSDKNLNPSTINLSTLVVTRSGPDQVFGTPDDVPVTVDGSTITVTTLRTGGEGAQRITFSITGASIVNDRYQVTLKGTGAAPLTDIAGNPLGGASGIGGADITTSYVVFSTASSNVLFVGAANYVTDVNATLGSRTNPYPTITEGLAAAVQGDKVAVLPGVYTESITLKSLVQLVSADQSSTAARLIDGNPLTTIIRAPSISTGLATSRTTVTAVDLLSVPGHDNVPGLDTAISGFTIASPLLGDSALGVLDVGSVGLRINNSDMLVTRNYFVDSGFGIAIETAGSTARTPRIVNNGLIGNATGLLINDIGGSTVLATGGYAKVINNTFAYNTFGVLANVTGGSPLMAQLTNNIFWQNHDQSLQKNGAAIYANTANKLVVRNNMFFRNGPDTNGAQYSGFNIGSGFDKSKIGTVPTEASQGNYIGDPGFVSPRDPRPGSDGPASFFVDANFDLTFASAAIDGGTDVGAPTTDFLGRTRRDIDGKGFPNTGPKTDVGAFEFSGVGGIPVGGAFRVVTTSVAPGGAVLAAGLTFNQGPQSIVVKFSGHIDPNSVTPNDLVITGDGLNNIYPAKAQSLTWIDESTVRFNLTGGFKFNGTVNLAIPQGAVRSQNGAPNTGFADTFKVNMPQFQAAAVPTTTQQQPSNVVVAPAPTNPVVTPAPAPAPTKVKPRKPRLFARRFNR